MSNEQNKNNDGPIDPNDTFKILLATDIHLGFEHSKKSKIDDSFITFEEILQYGKEHEVDFILLGGDLFHETKPSQTAMIKCVDLLRKYCLGSREIKIEFLSDPEEIFKHCTHKTVNYEDPNINVSMPIFSIHGNHDDPSFGALGSMDLLATTGLLNYFGKWPTLSRVTIPPLIIKKGRSHIALYGISYINDQRLSRLLRDCKFDLLRPQGIPDCFNIFVLHQNRAQHMENAYIPEHKLPDFLNFVVWGHEHECRIMPELIADAGYYICQPGSSIATSLCEGEAVQKHVAILSINRSKFNMKKLPLKTVRPFVFDNLYLKDELIKKEVGRPLSETVCTHIDQFIENVMMPEAVSQLTGHEKQPQVPLLRLRIFYNSEEEMFDIMRLSQKYCDVVTNPMEMIVWRKDKGLIDRKKKLVYDIRDDVDNLAQICSNETNEEAGSNLAEIAKKCFMENSTKLSVLSANGLTEALNRFVTGGDSDAFRDIMSHQMKETMSYLEKSDATNISELKEEMTTFRNSRIEREQEDCRDIQSFLNDSKRRQRDRSVLVSNPVTSTTSSDMTDVNEPSTKSTRGRKPREPSTRGRGRGRGRASNKVCLNVSEVTARSFTDTSPPQRGSRKQAQSTLQSFMDMGSQKSAFDGGYIDDSD